VSSERAFTSLPATQERGGEDGEDREGVLGEGVINCRWAGPMMLVRGFLSPARGVMNDFFDNSTVQSRKGSARVVHPHTTCGAGTATVTTWCKTLVTIPGLEMKEGTLYPLWAVPVRVAGRLSTRLENRRRGPARNIIRWTKDGRKNNGSHECLSEKH